VQGKCRLLVSALIRLRPCEEVWPPAGYGMAALGAAADSILTGGRI
jgi:hypothetical protein